VIVLSATWPTLLDRLAQIAQRGRGLRHDNDGLLESLGLINDAGLTDVGTRLYMARFVLMDSDQEAATIAELLKGLPEVNGFCEALWAIGEIQVDGAVNLIRRLTPADPIEAKRLLELMSRGRLITYNRKNPKMRVLYNPRALVGGAEETQGEKLRSHLLAPETRFGNLLSLREMLRAARSWIRWYELHMPGKVMEVLYREIESGNVADIRILSGPANVTNDLKADFALFRVEMKKKRGIEVEWRVLSKPEAQKHHDRFFLSEGLSRNLPPLNSILMGTTGEILPSNLTVAAFDLLWNDGTKLEEFVVSSS